MRASRGAYRVSLTTAVAIALMGLALPVAYAEPDGYQPQLAQATAVIPDGYQPQLQATVITTPDGYQPQLQAAQPTAVILRAGDPDGYEPSRPTIISFPAQVIADDGFAWWTGLLGSRSVSPWQRCLPAAR